MKKINDISQYIRINSKKDGKKTAIIFQGKKISYIELEKAVNILSISLIRIGVRPGDRIGILLSNSIEFVYILFAAARVGATIVPYNISSPTSDIKNNFLYTKIKFLIGWYKKIEKIFREKNFDKIIGKNRTIIVGSSSTEFINFDTLLKSDRNKSLLKKNNFIKNNYIIALTSGSTGNPKPIILSQKTKLLRSLYSKKLYKLNSNSTFIVSTPLYHTLAQRLVILPIILGGTSVILSGFSTKKWFELVKKHKVTFSILVSSQLENLINEGEKIFSKLKSLKKVVSSSAKLNNEIKKKLIKIKSQKFYEIYGTSEIANITNMEINKKIKKIESVGKECDFVSIKIIDSKKKEVKNGKPGEIICKTPLLYSGYLNKKRETELSFHKGYFKTGDIGYLDKNKYLYFLSRKKNIIIVGGINVYPEDIENCLKKNKMIKDCCVFGIDDKILGEKIISAIILKKKYFNEIYLKKYCLNNLADFQQPQSYFLLKDFPRNSLGKIDRYELKKRFMQKIRKF